MTPSVAAVVTFYNEVRCIGDCIRSLRGQTWKDLEIVAVDDGSTDESESQVRMFPEVKLIRQAHQGVAAARNLGVSSTSAEIVVFVDADQTLEAQYIEELTRPIRDGTSLCTAHRHELLREPSTLVAKCQGEGRIRPEPKSNVFRAISREALIKMGPFDPKLGYWTDHTLFLKTGLQADWVDSAVCYHSPSSTFVELLYDAYWRGNSYSPRLLDLSSRSFSLARGDFLVGYRPLIYRAAKFTFPLILATPYFAILWAAVVLWGPFSMLRQRKGAAVALMYFFFQFVEGFGFLAGYIANALRLDRSKSK